jgi:hypothetical protein
MLTAALLVAGMVAGAAGAAGQPPAQWVYATEFPYHGGDTPPELSLLRLDARTLAERARYRYGRGWSTAGLGARSPDGQKMAAIEFKAVRFFDLRRMRTSSVPVPELYLTNLTWVSVGEVVVLAYRPGGGTPQYFLLWIDVRRLKITRMSELPGAPTDFVRGREHALLVMRPRPQSTTGPWRFLGGPRRIYRVDSRSARLVSVVKKLRVAVEPWRVRRGAALPPGAAEALRRVREDFARREAVSLQSIQTSSVVPMASTWMIGRFGYQIVLGARGRFVEYWANVSEGGDVGWITSPIRETDVEPDLREHDLLRFPPGTDVVQADSLVANRSRTKLYLVTSDRALGVVDVASRTVRYRVVQSGGRLGTTPVLVGGVTAAWHVDEPGGMAFLNLETGRTRLVRPRLEGCRLEPASAFVLTYGAKCGAALTAFLPDGRVRFQLLRGEKIFRVQATSRYAYVTIAQSDSNASYFVVIDLQKGTVVRRVGFPDKVELFVGSGRRYY